MNFYEITKPNQCSHFIADNVNYIRKLEMLATNELTFPSPAKKSIILQGKYFSLITFNNELSPSTDDKAISWGPSDKYLLTKIAVECA